MGKPTILLVDDHDILVAGMRYILGPEYDVIGALADGEALASAAQTLRPDIIVASINLLGGSIEEAAGWIRKHYAGAKFVFLGPALDPASVRNALAPGGAAYLLSRCSHTELLIAIRHAAMGQLYITPSLEIPATLESSNEYLPADDGPRLTARQLAVLRSIADGHSAKETAALLNISSRTVEFHKYRLMNQLGVNSVAGLIRFAVREGISDS